MNIYIMLEWVGKMKTYQLLLYVKFGLQKILTASHVEHF